MFLALALVWPGMAVAQGACEAETAGPRALAQGVQLEITHALRRSVSAARLAAAVRSVLEPLVAGAPGTLAANG